MSVCGNQGADSRQCELLLDALMYRIKPEGRALLMRELPDAYNAYCGRDVARVVRVSDGEPI